MMEIQVVDYDACWAELYEKEAQRIKDILNDELLEIHHIGSTSVVGLKAKPIIDILPIVKNLSKIDALNQEFEALGYECMGEFGLVGRRYYRKGGNHRTHQIHLYEQSSAYDRNRHLAVRDYLRTHPQVAHEYGELKSQLALIYPEDIDAYCDGKDAFVKQMEKDALKWKNRLKHSSIERG